MTGLTQLSMLSEWNEDWVTGGMGIQNQTAPTDDEHMIDEHVFKFAILATMTTPPPTHPPAAVCVLI